ncbi:MAG TPA: MYXO-CTERM sorting domain-containing protein [Myxococcaceae bacterium]|nr:MYXO-CTERM sorting domain-containing protein [Myxococcaceae bacterium]
MRLKFLTLAVLGAGVVGCGGGPGTGAISKMDRAALATEAQASAFGSMSPVALYFMSQSLMVAEDSSANTPCPTISRDGDVTRVVGGCTTDEGIRYIGEATYTVAKEGRPYGTVEFSGFGTETPSECGAEGDRTAIEEIRFEGTMVVKGDRNQSELDFDVAVEGNSVDEITCALEDQAVAYVFKGTVDGPLPDLSNESSIANLTASTWNGTGKVGISEFGYVDIETTDEVIDVNTCRFGAISGQTKLTGDREIVITYRGAEQCGAAANWTLDGVDQGELRGVTCSAMGGGSLSAFGLLAVGGLLRRRRRDPR